MRTSYLIKFRYYLLEYLLLSKKKKTVVPVIIFIILDQKRIFFLCIIKPKMGMQIVNSQAATCCTMIPVPCGGTMRDCIEV